MQKNQFGKTSQLTLCLEEKQGKTILSHVDFTAPFKIMQPFYDENNNFSLMIMNSSSGIMSGDVQEISVTVKEGASGKIFAQSYEKIHKMKEGHGTRNCNLAVESGGKLHFSPLPTIPFADSSFQGNTEIHLSDSSSKLIYSEILSSGRVAMGETFQYTRYDTQLTVHCGEKLYFSDRAKFRPQEQNLKGFCLQENFTHQSLLLLFHLDVPKEKLESLPEIMEDEENLHFGFSQTHFGGIVFRFLANSGEILERAHQKVLSQLLGDSDIC